MLFYCQPVVVLTELMLQFSEIVISLLNILIAFTGYQVPSAKEVAEIKKLLQDENCLRRAAEEEVNNLKSQLTLSKRSEVR